MKRMRTRVQIVVIGLVLAVHALGDLAVLTTDLPVFGGWYLFLMAWPLSRGSLIALWAGFSPVRSYVRFPVAVVATAWAWYVAMKAFQVAAAHGAESASVATMFATQALIVLVATSAGRLLWRWRRLRQGSQSEDPLIPQYSLRFLLLWTTLLSIMLGAGRIVFVQLEWTSDVLQREYFYHNPMLAVHNAVFALLVFASLVGRTWMLRRILLAVVLIFAIGYFQMDVFSFAFRNPGAGASLATFLFLAGFQAAYLYATLLPLRLTGCFGGRKVCGHDQGE